MYEKQHEIICEDAKICCYDSGSGVPVVLLHGNGEDSSYWRKQVPVLVKAGFRVLAMDSRGHGRSEAGTRGLSFDLFADDLRSVFRALGITSAHVVGFSDGGNLAICFALKYPQLVDKLVLNGANIKMLSGVKPQIQLPLYPVVALLGAAGRFSAAVQRRRDILALMVRDYGVFWEDLHRLEMPALVIVGEHDMIWDAHSRRIAAELPNATFLRIGGASHFCAAEAPARFNVALLRFLR